MLQDNPRLSESEKIFSVNNALLNRVVTLFLQRFVKKPAHNRLTYAKKWEREKIVQLGLSSGLPTQNNYRQRQSPLTVWESEKIVELGLTRSGFSKKATAASQSRHSELEPSSFQTTETYAEPHSHKTNFHDRQQTQDNFLKDLGY